MRKTLTLNNLPPQGTPVDEVIKRECNNCRFWHWSDDDFIATCRRRPPYVSTVTGAGMWPQTHPSDWCGEFKRLPLDASK